MSDTDNPGRTSWLDADTKTPLIAQYAQRLESYLGAVADGRVDDDELAEQEARLVALMTEIEPQLNDALHAKITELLCEQTAYDIMQMIHSIGASRGTTAFRG